MNNFSALEVNYENIPNDTIIKYKIIYKKNNKYEQEIQDISVKTAINNNIDILCNSMDRSINIIKEKINLDTLLTNMKFNNINITTKLNIRFVRNNKIYN